MDIHGTDGDDSFVQGTTDEWNNYFGQRGNDSYKLYQGTVIGGPGNDRIERLPSADWWRVVQAAYWDSPSGVVVDLAGGWAEDGWGTRDTLVGVRDIAGSWQNDKLYGDGADNVFYVGGGNTVLDGRDGNDLVWLPVFNEGMALSEFTIVASIDGKTATATWNARPEFKTVMSNVERIGVGYQVSYAIADFIRPEDMAIQGLVAGGAHRWNASQPLGSATEVTYGFATSAPASGVGASGFQAFTEAQRASVRAILDNLAKITGLSFKEVGSGASMQFGVSQQLDTKGVGAMPGDAGAGQVWMDIESMLNLAPGSEGYAALLHEIGHALGLRHPRNVEAGDHYANQWRADDDLTSLTVMSQNAAGDGLFPSAFGALDITALRYLYGSKASGAGDTVYMLDTLRFQSQTSIVDDSGQDTIDASLSRTGVALDLTPGHLSSVGVTASGLTAVGNLAIAPGSWIEGAVGSDFDDVIVGNSLNNTLTGGKGNDWIDGGAGSDTAVFEGLRSDYLLSTGFGKLFVTARDGVSGFDTLLGIEKLSFKDGAVILAGSALGADLAIDVDQNASVAGSLPRPSDAAAKPATYAVKSAPANGVLALSASGDFVYTPRTGFSSEDSFSYTLSDANGSNVYMGFIKVRPISATIVGSEAADKLAGTAGNDIIDAGGGDDLLDGSAGNDALNGGAGMDSVRYHQSRSGVTFTTNAQGVVTVNKGAGVDTLTGIERVIFDNGAVALDIEGSAGQAYRLYQAAFDRKPDSGGLGFWIHFMDGGMSQDAVARGFMQSPEFLQLYGADPTPGQFVNKLYNNVLHRPGEPSGVDFWINALNAGFTRSQVLTMFAESPENHAQLIGVMQAGIDYLPS